MACNSMVEYILTLKEARSILEARFMKGRTYQDDRYLYLLDHLDYLEEYLSVTQLTEARHAMRAVGV